MPKSMKDLQNIPEPVTSVDLKDEKIQNFIQDSNLSSPHTLVANHRGAPRKKVKRSINRLTYLNAEEDAMLQEFCEEKGLNTAQALRMILMSYLKNEKNKNV